MTLRLSFRTTKRTSRRVFFYQSERPWQLAVGVSARPLQHAASHAAPEAKPFGLDLRSSQSVQHLDRVEQKDKIRFAFDLSAPKCLADVEQKTCSGRLPKGPFHSRAMSLQHASAHQSIPLDLQLQPEGPVSPNVPGKPVCTTLDYPKQVQH